MSLINNPKKAVIGVTIFVAIFVAGLFLSKCHAEPLGPLDAPYVQLSGGVAMIRGPAPVMDLAFTTPAKQLEKAYWQGSMTLIGSSSNRGVDAPNNMMLRGLFVDGLGRFDLGLGVAYVLNPYPYNGSNMNFALQADYRFERFPLTVTWAHVSNAGMTPHNLGRDMLLFGWRFH